LCVNFYNLKKNKNRNMGCAPTNHARRTVPYGKKDNQYNQ